MWQLCDTLLTLSNVSNARKKNLRQLNKCLFFILYLSKFSVIWLLYLLVSSVSSLWIYNRNTITCCSNWILQANIADETSKSVTISSRKARNRKHYLHVQWCKLKTEVRHKRNSVEERVLSLLQPLRPSVMIARCYYQRWQKQCSCNT